ncbi:MAG: Kae1-associated kinase Bud32 [Archaeoglobaceae archaeon]|nr:Kae1-associated kinase Bud32 [Archaeoglobaceae archaeon]MDW8117943.1 Kae1-associated kinase Bud32 [Archaeoglobaceae archaeon]
MIYLGGEAEVRIGDLVVKKRKPKRYRLKEIDEALRIRRTRTEAKLISMARRIGVPTPIILDVEEDTIVMERIYGIPVKDCMSEEISREIGRLVAKLHSANIIHGDITPMNMILSGGKIYFVDFGLAFIDNRIEAKGVDLHVYFESLKAGFENWERLRDAFIEGYLEFGKEEVVKRAKEIEERGRYVERRLQ